MPVSAPRDELWYYISHAKGLACWQADQVQGSVQEGEFILRWPRLGIRMDLSVLHARHHETITFKTGQTKLSLSLTEDGIHLVQDGLEEPDDLEGLRCSWRVSLALLAHAAERHPRCRRHVKWLFEPVPFEKEVIRYYYTEPRGIASWLGATPTRLREGHSYELALDHGKITGKVLVSHFDVALTVDQLCSSVLVLRSLPATSGRRVAAAWVSLFDKSIHRPLLLDLHEDLLAGFKRLRGLAASRGSG